MLRKKKSTEPLWSKLWKSFAAVAIVWGWISAAGKTVPVSWLVIAAGVLITVVIYWHSMEILMKIGIEIKEYFVELRKDVKYIKEKVSEVK